MSLAGGTRVGPYEILSPLGAGGMGEVYRARDARLGRDVAIKVLPEDSLADPERLRRFEREAKAAGALNHPNLLAIYDVGTHAGSPYIVSELLEGETLRERLRPGALSPAKAVEIAMSIARGLAAVHAKGIVHRDLKPANVFVSVDGHVKILDFGLAKQSPLAVTGTEGETASQGTGAGVAMGTPGYMSPEQIRGQRADHRSDIFSLGILLHEMVSGRKPFRGDTAADVMTAVLREDPPELSESGAQAPPGLQRIVRRCLEKRPEDRFHSAHDLALALESVPFGSTAPAVTPARIEAARTGIAVLPFVSLSAVPDDYFADGITEDVIAQLSKIGALRVTSRTSAMQFKKRQASLREIGERLGVSKVLDGSVRRAGSRVRIVAQLVDAATDEHLWTETYDRELSDVFAVQSDVALNVAGSLRAVLSPVERERVHKRPTEQIDAYKEYLLGRFHLNKRSDEGLRLAIAHFERAVALDPGYASAHSGLADAYNVAGLGYTAIPLKDAAARAKAAAQRALALDEALPEAHASLGFGQMMYDWDFRAAEQSCRKALELNPSHAPAFQWCAQAVNAQGRYEDGLVIVRRAAELDPLSVNIATEASWPLLYLGRWDEAILQLRKALELDPGFALAHYNLGNCYENKGMFEHAVAAYEKAVALSGRLAFILAGLARIHARIDRQDEARRLLAELLERAASAPGMAFSVAIVYDALDEHAHALDWLEKGYAGREPSMCALFMDKWLPFESVRSTPRFQSILARIDAARSGSPSASDKQPTPAPVGSERSLVVLPFENLSPDPDNAFFADGLTDELIGELTRVRPLRVISRTTAMLFKGAKKSVPAIARELKVRFVLEGSVRRAGDDVRISAQLVDAAADVQVWAEKYSGKLDDVFRVQEQLALRIVDALKPSLTPEEKRQWRAAPDAPKSAIAYDHYLRANEMAQYDQVPAARELYLRCVELDPGFAPAWARLARTHLVIGKYIADSAGNYARAEEALRRALEISPLLPLAHRFYAQLEADTGHAREALLRLLAEGGRRGNDPELFAGLVYACRYCGLVEQSIAAHEAARRLDPHVPTSLEQTLLLTGDVRRLLEVTSREHPVRVIALGLAGRRAEARLAMADIGQRAPLRSFQSWMEWLAAWVDERRDDMLARRAELAGLHILDDPESVFQEGWMLCEIGDHERGFDCLRRAVSGGFFAAGALVGHRIFDPLRARPAFRELLSEAEARRREGLAAFREAGGERLLRA